MRINDLAILACVACGRTDGPLVALRASLWPNARACLTCLTKYATAALAREADETVAGATPATTMRLCRHCGERWTLGPWCNECERERLQIAGA